MATKTCACGGTVGPTGECAACRARRRGARSRGGHEFGEVGVHAVGTRNPHAVQEDDVQTQGEAIGGAIGGVVGGALGGGMGAAAGAAIGGRLLGGGCWVTSGPSYTPSGTIPVTTSGGRKRARFDFAASFGTLSLIGKKPSCCEVRQYIKWDSAFATWRGGPPHSGFPSGAAAGAWIEDRDQRDKRYGHRAGTHTDPLPRCGDEYLSGGVRDQANGDTYCGNDNPFGPTSMTGQWQFQLKVIDTCAGNAEKASSSVITVNW